MADRVRKMCRDNFGAHRIGMVHRIGTALELELEQLGIGIGTALGLELEQGLDWSGGK